MVWAFISTVHHAARADEAEERSLNAELDGLRRAIERGTTAEVRAAASAALDTVTTAIEERRERQRRHVAELGERLAALGSELDAARQASTLDPLTGLANRKAFDDFLRRLVELHGFVPRPACLLMIDLDDLKRINDDHGHQAGDEALRQVAGCMTRVFLRRYDFVGRYGGDEFAVVLRDTPMAGALARAEQLRESVRAIVLPGSARGVTITLSAGVAELVKGETVTEWLARADRALYTAKGSGRDRVIQAPDVFG
jgi:diguanylate cyclase